jgi:ATP-dependent Clp protease ATP-binding subunit ClpA
MWERFTERAKKVMSIAREEAMCLGSEYVRTEHILLAICRVPECIAGRALEKSGMTTESVVMEVELQVGRGDAVVSGGEIAFSQRAKIVLELAVDEARRFSNSYIGTEHILLGLTKEGEGGAARLLADFQVDYTRIQAEVNRLLGGEEECSLPRKFRDSRPLSDRGKIDTVSTPTRQVSTKPSQKLIKAAREEATKRGDKYVWPQHILFALCTDPASTAALALKGLDVDLNALASTTREPIPNLETPPPDHMGEYSPEGHEIMECAVDEAFESGRGYLGTEHVLLALAKSTHVTTAEALQNAGTDYARIQAEIERILDDDSASDDKDRD